MLDHNDKPDHNLLARLARKHGTDKLAHGYLSAYEHLLGPRRLDPLVVLEIGIGGSANPGSGGASLRMWKEYLPKAKICGIDVWDKSSHAEERIEIRQGRQDDHDFLLRVARELGPFDLIIDDGSHINRHIIRSFETLFYYVADGGYYVVEDVHTSYWPRFGGSWRTRSKRTAMAAFKQLADHVNYAEFEVPFYHPSALDKTVEEVRFRHGMVIIAKSQNDIPSVELPPHPRSIRWFLSRQTSRSVSGALLRIVRPSHQSTP